MSDPLGKSFETTSGLLEEFEMEFEEAWFGTDPNYMNGTVTIFIVRGEATLDGEVLEEEQKIFYSLGDGWNADNGGESASHGSGKVQFNQNSGMGRFIKAAVALDDDALIEALRAGGEAYEAKTWRSLRFHFQRFDSEFNDRKTGEKRTNSIVLPVAFLGSGDAKPAAKGKSKAAATTSTPAKRRSRGAAATEEEAAPAEDTGTKPRGRRKPKAADDGLRDELIAFAAEWEGHADFMETALDSTVEDGFARADEVNANEELLNEVLDPDSALWAASRE